MGRRNKLLFFVLVLSLALGLFLTSAGAIMGQEPGYLDVQAVEYKPGEVIIKFEPGLAAGVKNELKGKHGLKTERELPLIGAELVKITNGKKVLDVVDKLKNNPNVVYIEPNYLIQPAAIPNDPFFSNLWGLHNSGQSIWGSYGINDIDIDALEAWDITQGSPEIVVAVIDTGVDISHPDLAANIWINPGEIPGDGIDNDGNGFIDDVYGWDFYHNDNSVYDPGDGDRHGTHVAGTIAAIANNNRGIAGVAPNVKIMPVKFLGPYGGYTSDAIDALAYAQSMGATLANNSWGGGSYSAALKDAITNFGGLFVAAAGNNKNNNDLKPFYPASYDNANIISVAAIDNQGMLASFSNYGAAAVHVGAPGVDVYSLLPGNSYGWASGTSMAAPHVSGIAALLASIDSALSPVQVKNIINETAVPLPSLQGKTLTGGMANAYEALLALNDGPYIIKTNPVDGAKSVPVDQSILIYFNENIQPGINFSSIALAADTASVIPINVSTGGNVLTIVPVDGLNSDLTYTVVIPKGAVRNEAEISMNMDYSFSFSTPDTIGPNVVSTDPADGAEGVSIYQTVSVSFDEEIKPGLYFGEITINGQVVSDFSKWINGNILNLYLYKFDYVTEYQVFIPAGAVTDTAKNALTAPYTFSFTTEPDNIAPIVYYNDPYHGDKGVNLSKIIRIMFSEKIQESSNYAGITLMANNTSVELMKSINGAILTLAPAIKLDPDTVYAVTVPAGAVKDLAGNDLVESINSSFTTGTIDFMELPFMVTDGVIDQDRSTLYLLESYLGNVYKLDYETGSYSVLSFNYAPVSIDLGQGQFANEIYVAINNRWPIKDRLQEESELGTIVVIDKTTFTIKDEFKIGIEPFDIVAGRDGHIYVTPATGQWADFISYNRVSKAVTDQSGIRHMSYARLHPTMERIYTINTDVSPRDFTAYNISGGYFTDPAYPGGYDSPYHGHYPLDVNFDIDPLGKYIFNGSGNIFATSLEKVEDMVYVGSLDGGFTGAAFSTDLSAIYTLPFGTRQVNEYRGSDYSRQGQFELGGLGRFLFYQNGKLIVLFDTASTGGSNYPQTGLQVIELPDSSDSPPVVSVTDPADNAVNQPINKLISITFSEDVVQGTAYDMITLMDSTGNQVSATKNINGSSLTISHGGLAYNTGYKVAIPAGAVGDLAGNPLGSTYSFNFTTEEEPDAVAPIVSTTDPDDGEINVPINKIIIITFSEQVEMGTSFEGINLVDGSGNDVSLAKDLAGPSLAITPQGLSYGTAYTVTIPGGSVKDLAGNMLAADVSFSFTTEAPGDTAAPVVMATDPVDNAVDVPVDIIISVGFNEDIMLGNNAAGIKIMRGKKEVTSSAYVSENTLIITPAGGLNPRSSFTVEISAGAVADLAGNSLEAAFTFTFSTGKR